MRPLAYAIFCSALIASAVWARPHAPGALTVRNAWSPPAPPGAPTLAGFLTISNAGQIPARLVDVTTPEASNVEIHQTTMTAGVMRMRRVAGGLLIPPGHSITLAPIGYHLMLLGPKRSFGVGDRIRIRLRFERRGTLDVDLPVRAPAPETGGMAMSPRDRR